MSLLVRSKADLGTALSELRRRYQVLDLRRAAAITICSPSFAEIQRGAAVHCQAARREPEGKAASDCYKKESQSDANLGSDQPI